MTELTHFDERGRAHMVDVGGKAVTSRRAIAEGHITMAPATLELIVAGGHKKGDVIGIARVAGIMAAKKTADLIPLCHPLGLTRVAIECEPDPEHYRVMCRATAETQGQTGVEMEALTAVAVAALTIYDMCKAVDKDMVIASICLQEKQGGNSGHYRRSDNSTE